MTVGIALGGLLGAAAFTSGSTVAIAAPAAVAGLVAGGGAGEAEINGACAALGCGIVASSLLGVGWILATAGVALAAHELLLRRGVAAALPLVVWLPALLPVGYLAGHGAAFVEQSGGSRRWK